MAQGKRVEVSAAQRTEIWRRWKAGESLHEIGRAFGSKHTSIHLLLSHHGMGVAGWITLRQTKGRKLEIHPADMLDEIDVPVDGVLFRF